MSLSVFGAGLAAPPHEVAQPAALELAERVLRLEGDPLRQLRAIYQRSGVDTRRTAIPPRTVSGWSEHADGVGGDGGATTNARMRLYAELAPTLALEASRQALDDARVDAERITQLVTVSCTGFDAPGVDIALIERLGLRPTTERVHVGFMGCHGAVNALRVAAGLAAQSPANRILLCAVELCSLHYFFGEAADRLVSNALFADGAAAVVVGQPVGGQSVGRQPSKGQAAAPWRVLATGSCLIPDSTDAMGWRVGDYGFEMSLSPTVPSRVAESLRPWLVGWLDGRGVALGDVEHWILHPGGPKILTAVAESLGLAPEATAASRGVLARRGNMSSPTVLFIAEELRQQRAEGLGVMLAFGPGLTAEAALVEFTADSASANPRG